MECFGIYPEFNSFSVKTQYWSIFVQTEWLKVEFYLLSSFYVNQNINLKALTEDTILNCDSDEDNHFRFTLTNTPFLTANIKKVQINFDKTTEATCSMTIRTHNFIFYGWAPIQH